MTWTDETPSAPGIYLWRAKGDGMGRWRLLELDRHKDRVLRVADQQAVAVSEVMNG